MKRLAIISVYPYQGMIKGGVEGVTNNISQAIINLASIDVHVLAPAIEREPGFETHNGINIHWLPVPDSPGFIHYWTSYRKTIHKKLLEINPDISHFQGVAGWMLNFNKPRVLTIHGINENDVLYSTERFKYIRYFIVKSVEKFCRKRCNDIIVISPYVLDVIGRQIKGNTWHIENPVSPDFFDVKRSLKSPIVLYVGRINSRKNIMGLIQAFYDVVKVVPEATLRLAGPADKMYEEQCKDMCLKLNLNNNVKFIGGLGRPDLLKELSSATCLALVSHQETAPMVVEEAMSAGVPVVVSNICGLPYMVEHGKTGYLVDQNKKSDISKYLARMLSDKEKTIKMSLACSSVAKQRFHVNSVVEKTLAVYESILSSRE